MISKLRASCDHTGMLRGSKLLVLKALLGPNPPLSIHLLNSRTDNNRKARIKPPLQDLCPISTSRDAFFVLLVHCRCSAQDKKRVENANNFHTVVYILFVCLFSSNIVKGWHCFIITCISHEDVLSMLFNKRENKKICQKQRSFIPREHLCVNSDIYCFWSREM